MIIETSSNQFFRVAELATIPQAWLGVAVKRVKGEWIDKKGAKPMLVRKAATRVVEG